MTQYSLVRRLVLSTAIWAVSLLVLGALSLTWLYRESVYHNLDDPLDGVIGALIAFVEPQKDGSVTMPRYPADPRYETVFSGRYWVIAQRKEKGGLKALARSRSLYDTHLPLPDRVFQRLEQKPGLRLHFIEEGPLGEPLRLAAQSVFLPEHKGLVIFIAAANRENADRRIRNFSLLTAWLLAFFTLGLIFAVIFQVRLGLAPLFRLRKAVAEVREGREDMVKGHYPHEIEPLAQELNALMHHTRDVVERARTHVGNLAHALKTPLSVLMYEASQKTGDFSDLVRRQTDLMTRQTEHHLRRARAAASSVSLGQRTPLAPVFEDLNRTMKKIYRDSVIDVTTSFPPGMMFLGERHDLEEMIGNLLENAYKWARTTIHAEAQPCAHNPSQWCFYLDDDGPGLDKDQRRQVLQRGTRLDETVPGSGLGLAIIADLARSYKGSLSLERSPLGGLRVLLTLPLAS